MRKDQGGLAEYILALIEDGNEGLAAQHLSLLHPFVTQQCYARAVSSKRDALMVTLTPALWGECSRDHNMEHEGTRVIRHMLAAFSKKDPLLMETAVEAGYIHLHRVGEIPSDGSYPHEDPRAEKPINDM